MGKVRRKSSKGPAVAVYDSDDDQALQKEAAPDPQAESFYHDEVDDFHAQRDKILLDKPRSLEPAEFSSDEDEVLKIDDDEDDEDEFEDDEEIQEYESKLQRFKSLGFKDEMGSDMEDDQEDGLPNERAWGSSRNKFYGGDVDSDDDIDFSGSDTDAAILEEQEAMALQKKMAEQLEDQDFDLDIFKTVKKPEVTKEEKGKEKIEKDLSQLSKREKLQLLKKESPELLDLIEDYKLKMRELHERLLPIHTLIQQGSLPPSKGCDYITTKVRLYLNYCTTLSFYMMLKAKQTPVHSHPVIDRLVQYRNLLKQLEKADEQVKPEIDGLLETIKKGDLPAVAESDQNVAPKSQLSMVERIKRQRKKIEKHKEKRKLSQMLEEDGQSEEEEEEESQPEGGRTWGRKRAKEDGQYETRAEKEALANYEMMKGGKRSEEEREEGYEEDQGMEDGEGEFYEEEADEKRSITKEMLKNKGLTPHRKKENRNPRVKHRMKFKKAKIRRKGQVREVRHEMDRYGGEISGIRAGIKRSVKLK